MGKLGKKARKFAKKNLQGVLRQRRKLKSKIKKRAYKNASDIEEEQERHETELSNGRRPIVEHIEDASLDAVFSEDESDVSENCSDSDGYLLEDPSCAYGAENGSENCIGESDGPSMLSLQNKDIISELVKKSRRLKKIKEKDSEFSKFLESHKRDIEIFRNGETDSDEEETCKGGMELIDAESSNVSHGKLLTSDSIDALCQLVKDQPSVSALTYLLNAYRAACHSGSEENNVNSDVLPPRIQNGETFCKILIFTLYEADNIFRRLLGISSSNDKKGMVLELTKMSKWATLKPLIKSYLRSTLFLLNQVTDSEILAISITRIRASIILFDAFPSLLHRLTKIAVHMWATGDRSLSSHCFTILRDVASVFGNDWFEICWVKMYNAFIGHCQSAEPALFEHIKYLRNSFVELCSLDVQKSSAKTLLSIEQLAKILQKGQQTKKKEVLMKICSWQYINCIDLWVMFISENIRDYDLQPLAFLIIQTIIRIAFLFSGPRYMPLRIKCIKWLNHLSSSSGIFIPVASLVLDLLEYKIGKDSGKPQKEFNIFSAIKLPKHWLKSQNFLEVCVISSIELLSEHFSQWSYHISFPELAAIPLTRLRNFYDISSNEGSKRSIKRFIGQVELNIVFVEKKRDEAAFSPKDQQAIESFLQIEKHASNAAFTQYYKSVINKAASRSTIPNQKLAGAKQIKKRRQDSHGQVDVANANGLSEKIDVNNSANVERNGKKKKLK